MSSDQSTQVVYQGMALASRQTVFWKVQVWDKDDQPGAWSPVGTWEMGLLGAGEWQSKWIAAQAATPFQPGGLGWIWYPEGAPATSAPSRTRLFRRTFTLPAGVMIKSATCAITADDSFQLFVNGAQIGSSDDWHTLKSYDIASHLTAGANTVAVQATDGTESPAGLVAQLSIDTGSGGPMTISTDTSWKASNQAPAPGWQAPGFNDGAWPTAMVGASFGAGPWGSPTVGGGGPVRDLRRAFTVSKGVKRARLYATALGTYEPSLNGARVGDQSFGSVDEWMYQTIAGLTLDEDHPGWKQSTIRPQPGGGLTSARATLDSPQGLIVSDWMLQDGKLTLTATVPVNATAKVYLPYTKNVQRDGVAASAPAADGGYALGSGTYVFVTDTQ